MDHHLFDEAIIIKLYNNKAHAHTHTQILDTIYNTFNYSARQFSRTWFIITLCKKIPPKKHQGNKTEASTIKIRQSKQVRWGKCLEGEGPNLCPALISVYICLVSPSSLHSPSSIPFITIRAVQAGSVGPLQAGGYKCTFKFILSRKCGTSARLNASKGNWERFLFLCTQQQTACVGGRHAVITVITPRLLQHLRFFLLFIGGWNHVSLLKTEKWNICNNAAHLGMSSPLICHRSVNRSC